MKPISLLLFGVIASSAWSQTNNLVEVISKPASRTLALPAEILPFLNVSIHAKVTGYVEQVLVDRGSVVKQGDKLIQLSAPEMQAQIAEAQSKLQAAQADRLQAEAQLAASQSTYDRLKMASETAGAIAANELTQAEKQVDAAKALVDARGRASAAAESALRALQDLSAYLAITAPFDGVITDRFVHPGALVGPSADTTLLIVQQISSLRLVVPVPEDVSGEIISGAKVDFHVPAYPERTYSGTVARVAHALDPKTRTMPVELNVANRDGSLAPGMFPTVSWPVRSRQAELWVPRTSVVTTTERTFVIRDRDGHAAWVDVKKGVTEGDLTSVLGNLKTGDKVVRRATDEIRDGAPLEGSGTR
jgi:RND family efflux transporter MFP subunit